MSRACAIGPSTVSWRVRVALLDRGVERIQIEMADQAKHRGVILSEIAGSRVFTFGAEGWLGCRSLADGTAAWDVDAQEESLHQHIPLQADHRPKDMRGQ